MTSKAKNTAGRKEANPALLPKLRFPEFQGTEQWKAEPMGEVYSFKGNNSLSRDKLNYAAGTLKNIHYGDIHTKFSSHFDITKERVPFINDSELSALRQENLCAEGDMVFADASEDMADIGKCIELVYLKGERLVSGLHTILARRTGDRIALGFGGHLFNSGWVRTQIQREAQGAKVLGISANRMNNLRLPLPSPAEQQRIADCLTSVDEVIAAQARKVDALKTHKKGLMQRLFPSEGETQPRLRFAEFRNARKWGATTLGSVARLRNGYAFKSADYVDDGPYRIITIANVQQGNLAIESTKRIPALPPDIQQHQILSIGEILISMTGNVGRVCCVTAEDLLLNQRVGKLTPDKINAAFFYQLLQREEFRNSMQLKAAGGAQGNLSGGDITEYAFHAPAEPREQQRVASCLSSLDALITAETQKHAALQRHKRGLMQRLFPVAEEGDT